jgi:hypothetical protein
LDESLKVVLVAPDGVGVSCFSHAFAVEYRQTPSRGEMGHFLMIGIVFYL